MAGVLHQPVQRRRALIVLAAVLASVYVLSVLTYAMFLPDIGVRCAFAPTVNLFYPEFLDPQHDQTPIPEGATIEEVAGRKVESWPQLLRALIDAGKKEPATKLTPEEWLEGWKKKEWEKTDASAVQVNGHRIVRVVYRQPGETTLHEAWCLLGKAPLETMLPSVLWLFLKMGLFLVGALVYWKRPEDPSARQFFLFCLVSVGAYIGGYHWSRIVTQPILLLVFMGCAFLLPAVSLHFYLVFPRPKTVLVRHSRWTLGVLYGPALLFILLILSGYLRVRWLAQDTNGDSAPAIRLLLLEMLWEIYVYFGIAAMWYLCSVVCLVHSFRHAANSTERNQVKWILLGSLAALVPIGYTLYLAFLQQGRFGGGAGTWPMFVASLFLTVAFTISITRYRLMQLDQILGSGIVYFLLSFLAGMVYYGLVFCSMLLLGSHVGDGPSLGQVLAVSSTALLLLLALDLARGRLKKVLDKHFRREKFQLDRTLLRMRQAIDQLVDLPTLARRLLHTSNDLLGVNRGAVYLRHGQPPLYQLADALGPTPTLTELPPGCPLITALSERGILWGHDRLAADDPALRQLQFLGGEVAQALSHEGQLLGLLVLGPKDAGTWTPEDFALLTAFAQLIVLALVSAEGHRTIESLNVELQVKVQKIAEQQRRILALQSQLSRGQESGVRSQESGVRGPEEGAGSSLTPDSCPLTPGMVGSSTAVRQLVQLVRKVASSSSAVLLRGESGTGKEILARLLHESSPRAGKPFVKVHCAALAPSVLESELFGHVKGAFTNAIKDKMGRFEAADGGTVFLDEIGDISLDVQTKLLRVLQEMTFERVGSSEPIHVDVRIVAATHQNLEELIRQGRFREDLFYRLNVFPIQLPPLRDRLEDIPELVEHFLRLYAGRSGKALAGVEDDVLVRLKGYPWPGNVRELENVIERAVVVSEGPLVTVPDLPSELVAATYHPLPEMEGEALRSYAGSEHVTLAARAPYNAQQVAASAQKVASTLSGVKSAVQAERDDRERREREQLVRALTAAGGNKAEAARALGMARSTFLSRLKKLGLG
jgi:transcriptional regulator with GAF, ATPase, and Fis domain